MEQTVSKRIAEECAKHADRKARWKAMRSIKWVLRCRQLNLYAGMRGLEIVPVETMAEAQVFDGRDDEEMKVRFYRALTGILWEAELSES